MADKFILVDGEPVAADLMTWAKWMETNNGDRVLAKTQIGDVEVSTVFLGLDHGFGGPPLLWETMIFGGKHDQYQERYGTRGEAEAGHAAAVALVRNDA